MKGLSYSFLRAVCALVIGLVLVMFPNQAGDYFVITIGVIFLVPSLISIIGYYAQNAEVRRRFPIEGIGSLLFGLWLVIMPGFFADLLTFVLGFILVMGGVQQIASLSAARSRVPSPPSSTVSTRPGADTAMWLSNRVAETPLSASIRRSSSAMYAGVVLCAASSRYAVTLRS